MLVYLYTYAEKINKKVLTLNFLMALPNASMVSMSKWFVGSSKMRKLGTCANKTANATLDFWPPDKLQIYNGRKKELLWQRQTDRQLYNTNKDKMSWGKKSLVIKFEFSFGAKYSST